MGHVAQQVMVTEKIAARYSPLPMALDAHAILINQIANNTLALGISPVANNTILVAIIYSAWQTSYKSVSSVTDSAGLTWTRRSQLQFTAAGGPYFMNMEVWWAPMPTAGSGTSVTATFSGTPNWKAMELFTVSGVASSTSPWDSTGNNTYTYNNNITAQTPSATMSTTAANTFSFGGLGVMDVGTVAGVGSGKTLMDTIQRSAGNYIFGAEYVINSVSTSVTMQWTGAQNYTVMVVDSLAG
jgi:hypothetical protein